MRLRLLLPCPLTIMDSCPVVRPRLERRDYSCASFVTGRTVIWSGDSNESFSTRRAPPQVLSPTAFSLVPLC